MVASESNPDGGLRIRLLGGLELRSGGLPLPLPASRRTRALLGYLVETGNAHSRTSLCDLLWDGPDDPRASLRWSLTKLRAVVDGCGGAGLCADREKVAFEARDAEVDTRQACAALGRGDPLTMPLTDLEALAECLHGEFLDGLDLPACYRFHHWCVTRREHYGVMRRNVLAALTTRLAGQPQRALPYGHAMVEADPLGELAHATLVRLLGAAGHYPQAERHYEWARDLLRREVATAPGGPLDDAIHRLRRDLRSVDGADGRQRSAPPEVSPQPAHLPAQRVVGRERESAVLEGALRGRLPPRLLLLAGEPGIGKTCLLDRFAEVAPATGHQLIRGRCFEAETVRPYGLWLDALGGIATAGIDPALVAQAAPLLDGDGRAGGSRELLFDAVLGLLKGMAEHRPIAMAFDDLQWIDEGSAALLHFVVRHLAGRGRFVFAGAARPGAMEDSAAARTLLQSLSREGLVQRLDLAPLSLAEASTLLQEGALATGVGPRVDDPSAGLDPEAAWRLSGGNPLYLVELARAAARGEPAGEGIDDLIGAHLRSLDDDARDLLAWAAAAGREVAPLLLAEASGLPMGDVLSRLDRLERHGLLAPSSRRGQLDFMHDLVRQTLYRSLSPPRRQAIHDQYARALRLASDADPGLHGEIVRHAELAGDDLAAAQACLAAGQHCLRLFANPQAAEVAERGLRRVAALPPGAQRVRLEIALLRLRVAAAAGPAGNPLPDLADRILRAVTDAEGHGLLDEAACGWETLAYLRQWSSGSGDAREATLAAERATRRGDAATHCAQLANSGRCLLDIEADVERGRELLAEATAQAAALGLQVMEIEWGRGLVARAAGDLGVAREALSGAVALAQRAANHWREFECMVWLATVELEQGRHGDVMRHVEEILAAAARMGEQDAPFAQAIGALARLRGGHDGPAEKDLLASLVALRERDDKAHLAYGLNELASQAQAAGRWDVAARSAAEAFAAARTVRRATELVVAAARLAVACAGGGAEADALLVDDAREMVAGWPHSWPLSGPPSARAAAAMAAAQAALRDPVSTVAQTPAP